MENERPKDMHDTENIMSKGAQAGVKILFLRLKPCPNWRNPEYKGHGEDTREEEKKKGEGESLSAGLKRTHAWALIKSCIYTSPVHYQNHKFWLRNTIYEIRK